MNDGRLWLAAIWLCGIASITAAETAAPGPDPSAARALSGWNFAVTPYLWLPSVDGSLRYNFSGGGPPQPEVDMSDASLIDYLSGAFMLSGEVKKDRWLALTDFIYVDFANAGSHVRAVEFQPVAGAFDAIDTALNTQTETSLTAAAWTLLGGYQVTDAPVDIDVLGGLRYFGLRGSTDWNLSAVVQGPGGGATFPQSGNASDSTEVWDALFALRAHVPLGRSRWFLPLYADVGAGESQLTWQAYGGVGYAFKWLEISLVYRTIYYDERNQGLMNKLTFTGPAAAFSFRF